MQTKIYLIGNSTVRQSSLNETLTVCIEAPQGSFTKKNKVVNLWSLSESLGRIDLHRKYQKSV